MKIYQGQQGQFGDILISLKVSEELSRTFPDARITMGASKSYSSILELIKTAPYVQDTVLWEGYCDYSEKDKEFIRKEQFDLFYCPFQASTTQFWKTHHQVADAFVRHKLLPPNDLQIKLPVLEARNPDSNIICISVFPNFGVGVKSWERSTAQDYVDCLVEMGYDIVQLDGEKPLKNILKQSHSWLETASWLCTCRLLITGDTAVSWLASAYNTPTLGLYALGYYFGAETSKNWQPINPNAVYLEADNVNNIKQELIEEKLDALLNI